MKSSIQASIAPSLPRAARRRSTLSWARRSARRVAWTLPSSSESSSGCSCSQATTSRSASRYSFSFSSATGTTTWRFSGSCGSTSFFRRRTKQVRRRCQWIRSSAPAPWKRRLKRAPEPNSSRRPMIRSCEISSSGWFMTGVPVRQTLQRALGQLLGEAADRARALGLRVLDVVGLVEDQRLRAAERQPLAVGVDDLVVEDRDVGLRDRLAGADDDVQRAVRQPVLGLALPVELQAGRADHDRRVGVVLLEQGERLDGLAQALLVGDEQPPRLAARTSTPARWNGPQLAAEPVLAGQRVGVGGARAADGADRRVVLDRAAGPARRGRCRRRRCRGRG